MSDACVPILWDQDCMNSTIYQDMMNGIEERAQEEKLRVVHYPSAEELLSAGLPAKTAIVIGYESPALVRNLTMLLGAGLQVVLAGLDGERFGEQISDVTPGRSEATIQLAQYLFDCGRKKIALVGCGNSSVNDLMRVRVLQKLMAARSAGGSSEYMYRVYYFIRDVMESLLAFCDDYREFDAVICPNDYTALCLLHELQKRGIRVPEDLYVSAFSNRILGKYCKPSLTTMAIDFFAVGRNAFLEWRLLEEHADEKLRMQIHTQSQLIVRESTGGELHPAHPMDHLLYDSAYQGEPFYDDGMIQAVMQIEQCLIRADELDIKIIGALLDPTERSYEDISASLFISTGSLNYRSRKIFASAGVKNRKEFQKLFEERFTKENHF